MKMVDMYVERLEERKISLGNIMARINRYREGGMRYGNLIESPYYNALVQRADSLLYWIYRVEWREKVWE